MGVATASAQLDRLVVVDDGSGPGFDAVFAAIEDAGAEVMRLPQNSGIATALNAGVRRALDGGAAFIVTLDQDSLLPPEFVRNLRMSAQEAGGKVSVGAVVPEYFADVRQAREEAAPGVLRAQNVIQSGMLVPRHAFEAAGLFRGDFFIDLVDTEFELRLQRAGFLVIAAPGVRMGHQLGTQFERRLLGMRVRLPGVPDVVTVSTPFRYFYRVRNRLVLNREYRTTATPQLRRDTILDVIHVANVLLLARPRRSMWRLVWAGMRAARAGRMGRMPDALMVSARDIRWAARPAFGGPLSSAADATGKST